MGEGRVFEDDEMSKFIGSVVGIFDVPTKLLLVSFTVVLKIKMNWNEHFLILTLFRPLPHQIDGGRNQNKLLIDGLIQGSISRFARIQALKPLSQSIFNFDVMSLHFALQPQ